MAMLVAVQLQRVSDKTDPQRDPNLELPGLRNGFLDTPWTKSSGHSLDQISSQLHPSNRNVGDLIVLGHEPEVPNLSRHPKP